jgi:hypothetical protein
MPVGREPGPFFEVFHRKNEELRSRGGRPWVYFAVTRLCFLTRGAHPRISTDFPFRLDTEAFVSLIPEKWVPVLKRLGEVLGKLSTPTRFVTVTGEGTGRLACNVAVQFPEAPGLVCRFDFLVTQNLNQRGYGLISLRDVLNHFTLETEGPFRLGPDGEPLALPVLRLHTRAGWARVRYWCPGCQVNAWGRPGLHLACGDCNRPLRPA